MANKRKDIKEILCIAVAAVAIISFFVIIVLYADGYFNATPMQQILPALLWCIFAALETMMLVTNITDSLVAMWGFGISVGVIAFVLEMLHLSTVVIITVAILGIIIAVMNIVKK